MRKAGTAEFTVEGLALRRAQIFDRLVIDEMSFSEVAQEERVTPKRIQQIFNDEYNSREWFCRRVYGCKPFSDMKDEPHSHGASDNLEAARDAYPYLSRTLRKIFDDRARSALLDTTSSV